MIVFLDIDGVLNSAAFFAVSSKRKFRRAKGTAKQELVLTRDLAAFAAMIDKVAMARLNRILTTTGALVVVSSSWRHFSRASNSRRCFAIAGSSAPSAAT